MQTNAQKRLLRDLKKLVNDPPVGIEAAPSSDDDIFKWDAMIFGPASTPWENGMFSLTLQFTEDYPAKPPQVKFNTKIFHPNVYIDGKICLDILKNQWSPIFDVASILVSIQSLLNDPNPNSPANTEAARIYLEDRPLYYKKVKQRIEDAMEDEAELFDSDEEEMDEEKTE